jgi:hypothetical protein
MKVVVAAGDLALAVAAIPGIKYLQAKRADLHKSALLF